MAKFTIEKVSNMIFISSEFGTVFYAWDESDFTKRKLFNAIAKLKGLYNNAIEFVFNGI